MRQKKPASHEADTGFFSSLPPKQSPPLLRRIFFHHIRRRPLRTTRTDICHPVVFDDLRSRGCLRVHGAFSPIHDDLFRRGPTIRTLAEPQTSRDVVQLARFHDT